MKSSCWRFCAPLECWSSLLCRHSLSQYMYICIFIYTYSILFLCFQNLKRVPAQVLRWWMRRQCVQHEGAGAPAHRFNCFIDEAVWAVSKLIAALIKWNCQGRGPGARLRRERGSACHPSPPTPVVTSQPRWWIAGSLQNERSLRFLHKLHTAATFLLGLRILIQIHNTEPNVLNNLRPTGLATLSSRISDRSWVCLTVFFAK